MKKRSFQLIGPDPPGLGAVASAASAGLSVGTKIIIAVTVVVALGGLVAVSGITGWNKASIDQGLDQAHKDLVAVNVSLGNRIVDVNTSLCTKVMGVNTTLLGIFDAGLAGVSSSTQEQLTILNDTLCSKIMAGDAALMQDILSLNGTSVNTTLFSQISMLNDSLCIKIMAGDALLESELANLNVTILALLNSLNTSLMTKITNGDTLLQTHITNGDSLLQTQIISINSTLMIGIGSSIASINNVTAEQITRNLDIVANGTGLQVQPHPMLHSVYLENTGVVTVNSVHSLSGSHNLLVTGAGMITVNSYPLLSTIEVDGSALSTSISNLQTQNNMQQMEITILEGNVTTLQTQITNLQMAGDMITQSLNGTTITFNMSIMTLMTEVMNLQSTVAALQAQVNSLSSGSVAPGTISPFGGTVVPVGYLLCDGSLFLQSAYPALYAIISTMYCGGTCTNTTFRVPDLRGKIPAGQGGTLLNAVVGTTVGAETHTLTLAEVPTHFHSGSVDGVGDHQHWIRGTINNPGSGGFPDGTDLEGFYTDLTLPAGAHSHTYTTNSVGSGGSHNNIQPSLIVKYIIKT